MDENRIRWQVGISEVINEMHPFKCGPCKKVTPHHYITKYVSEIEPDAWVWLMECQNCFEQRLFDPIDRVISREDEITRCDQCGNYKMKAAKCRICKIADGQERIKERYWNGNATLERFIDADI
jgi:hypothetical protein